MLAQAQDPRLSVTLDFSHDTWTLAGPKVCSFYRLELLFYLFFIFWLIATSNLIKMLLKGRGHTKYVYQNSPIRPLNCGFQPEKQTLSWDLIGKGKTVLWRPYPFCVLPASTPLQPVARYGSVVPPPNTLFVSNSQQQPECPKALLYGYGPTWPQLLD
jgi:hypothetical protein